MKKMKLHVLLILWFILMVFVGGKVTFAENIDPDDDGSQYTYGENIGWLNAEPLGDGGPGVTVADTKLTGYIWAENIGWVSLSCENTGSCGTVNYGVTNDGSGNLSGYAWGENVGWISFSCENTDSCSTVDYRVTIDPATGEFNGHAWGENIGWITLRSTGAVPFGVTTSWPNTIWASAYDGMFDTQTDLTLLRRYRDQLLTKSIKGKLYTTLLYQSSEEALKVLLNHPALMRRANKLIRTHKGAVEHVLNGSKGVIKNTDAVISFLKAYGKKSPPALRFLTKEVIREMRKQQRRGRLFLGFRLE